MSKFTLLCSAALVACMSVGVAGAQNNTIPNFAYIDSGWLLQGGIDFKPIPGKQAPISCSTRTPCRPVCANMRCMAASRISIPTGDR